MTAKDQLLGIYRIQQLALRMREAQATVEGAPGRIDEIEQRFRERNAEYVALQDRYDELEADRRRRTLELEDLEQKRTKFMEDQRRVTNPREYSAMLKEIDSVKAMISGHEDAILSEMDEIEKLKGDLQVHAEHIAKEREVVAQERGEVEQAEATARDQLVRLGEERGQIESGLPVSIQRTLGRLEQTRQGIFLSKAEGGTCQSCYVRVRPQVFQEIKSASKVHTCDSCRRFLYYEPSIAPPMPASEGASEASATPDASNSSDPNGIEAVDGGAV